MKRTKTKLFNFRITDELRETLKYLAYSRDTTVASLITDAIFSKYGEEIKEKKEIKEQKKVERKSRRKKAGVKTG